MDDQAHPAETKFGEGIGPANLLTLVRHTAPWLWQRGFDALAPSATDGARLADLAGGPAGWLAVVRAGDRLQATPRPTPDERVDYFALCLACHHATVATFCPTDVDSKIRGHRWRDPDASVLARQADLTTAMHGWDPQPVSTRVVVRASGPVSGHDGEWLGVACGALGGFLASADRVAADAAGAAVEEELSREAREFRAAAEAVRRGKGDELELLALAVILTHNVGDVDQGISHWPDTLANDAPAVAWKARLQRLAHENTTPFAGAFQIAAALYKRIMSAEGHRHYPLRQVKALRASPEFLLPIGPCLDAWGERLAGHRDLDIDDKAEIFAALHAGCRKIPGQVGYYRAIAGIAAGTSLDQLAKRLSSSARQALKDPEVKRHLQLRRTSFESSLRKQAQATLAQVWR